MNHPVKRRISPFFLAAILSAIILLVRPVSAQQQQESEQKKESLPDLMANGQGKADVDQANQPPTPKTQGLTSNDRIFYTMPDFLTLEDVGKVPPLTVGEKFKVVSRASFDIFNYPWYGLLAGVSQWKNSEAGYGQGAGGYGKRYAAAFGDGTIENFMTGAVLPSLLRQDPRFYQTSKGSFLHRLGYAASRIFITRNDSAREQFNYSEIFGSAMAAGISTYSYHPHGDRTLRDAASMWGTQVGYDTFMLVMEEFWPDIRRKLSHHSKPEPTSSN